LLNIEFEASSKSLILLARPTGLNPCFRRERAGKASIAVYSRLLNPLKALQNSILTPIGVYGCLYP
jgi:hypothetical protein